MAFLEKSPGSIDWEETHQRLAGLQRRLDQSWAPTPEETRTILQGRAKLLAREPEQPTTGEGSLQVLEFRLANEEYGIETTHVREVCPLGELTTLPGTPAFILGVTNVRGQILSIIDIKRFFDLPEKGLTDLNKVIIVRHGEMELGILADAILRVRPVATAEIQVPLPTLTGIRAEYLRGLTRELVAILDVERILSDERKWRVTI